MTNMKDLEDYDIKIEFGPSFGEVEKKKLPIKKLETSKKPLIIIGVFLLIVIAIPFIYYYFFFEPERSTMKVDKERFRQQREMKVKEDQDRARLEQEKIQAGKAEEKEVVRKREERAVGIRECLSEAQEQYTRSWEDYCLSVSQEKGCQMPPSASQSLFDERLARREDCYKRFPRE
jgi:hypothetical protein